MHHYFSYFLALFFLIGCASPYQKTGITGGFSETQLSSNAWRVSFMGNAYTSAERAVDFTLLRCAELTLQNGFTHFVIVENDRWQDYSTFTHGGSRKAEIEATQTGNRISGTLTTNPSQTFHYSRPRTSNTILCFDSAPSTEGMIFDAEFIKNSLRKKYGL